MGVWADEGWSFICGFKKNLPHPAFPSNYLPVTGGKPGLLYVKLNPVIFIYMSVPPLKCGFFCFEAILAADGSVRFGEDQSPSGSAA